MMMDKAWSKVASRALIVALFMGSLGVLPGVAVAAQEVSSVDPLLGVIGLQIGPIPGFDVDPLLGAVGLQIDRTTTSGTAAATLLMPGLDPLLGNVGLEVIPGSSIASVSGSDVDPLLGVVGLDSISGSPVALNGGVPSGCLYLDSMLVANPGLVYVPVIQGC